MMFRSNAFKACLAFVFIFQNFASAQTPENVVPPPAVVPTPKVKPKIEELEERNRKFQALESYSRVLSLLESLYVDENAVQSEALIEKAIKGMVSGLDPHTTYLPPSQLKDLTSDTSGRFGGVGIIITQQNNRLEIVEVVEDSPADKAGVKNGDLIYAVDKIVVTKENIEDILTRMRGLPGTAIQLEIIPAAEASGYVPKSGKRPKTTSVTLKREIIRSSSVTPVALAQGYGYVRISVFQEDTGDEVDKALRKFEADNGGRLNGLVLDLRNNPGGLLDQAVKVANLFIESGIIVSTVGRDRSKQEVEYALKRVTHPYMPLVVLVNEGSASASEIVAGALQDHERGLILGNVTFGKGSVQSIIPLSNGAGLKMTIARYYTPKGRSIQARGITPDVLLPSGKGTEKLAQEERNKFKKEADLEGHIESDDLSDVAKVDGAGKEMEGWPALIKGDVQVRVAYSYLKSWSRLGKLSNKTTSVK